MKIKTTMRCHLRPGGRAIVTKTRDGKCWQAHREASLTAAGNAVGPASMENSVEVLSFFILNQIKNFGTLGLQKRNSFSE